MIFLGQKVGKNRFMRFVKYPHVKKQGVQKSFIVALLVLLLIQMLAPGVQAQQSSSIQQPQSQDQEGIKETIADNLSKIITLGNTVHLQNPQKRFGRGQGPQFTLVTPEKNLSSKNVDAKLTDKSNGSVIPVNVKKTADGTFKVFLKDPNSLSTGDYQLTTSAPESFLYTRTVTQDFTWGVLGINTNKASYLPGEIAYLQMAALNNSGHTICNATLELTVEDASGNTQDFNTSNGTIKKSITCGVDNVTDNPDYYLYYKVGNTGTYTMKLTNSTNKYTVTDTFTVEDSQQFEVERRGATRINPFKSQYTMNIVVKANQDFNGVVAETVPDGFTITKDNNSKITKQGPNTVIDWNVNLKNGESKQLSYQYDAPHVSPQLYALGPLKFYDSGSNSTPIFQEARQWQIASDSGIQIRQEINIIDGPITATGNAVVQLDTTQYVNPTYYFETLANVSASTLTVTLQRKTGGTNDATISVTSGSSRRQRVSFTPPTGQTNYIVALSGGVSPNVTAARIIVIDNPTTLTSTETQIEIGNNETGKTNTAAAALTSPKYWLYTAANWNGTKTLYAEVTYSTSSTQTVTATLQEDNGSFASWADKVTIVSAVSNTTATRTRSVSFTPTDGRHYRISAAESSATGGKSYSIFNAKIIVDQSASPTLLEPQYLLLNTKSTATGTQGLNNLFDPTEWSGVKNTYKHAQDGIGATVNARIDDIDNSNAVLTNSSITGANQQIGSGITDMPSSAHQLDTDIVVVGTEVDASRILVLVTPVPTKIVFSNSAINATAGVCNTLTVQLQSGSSVATNPSSSTNVLLSSNSPNGQFTTDSSCLTGLVSTTTVSYTTSQNSQTIYYYDTKKSPTTWTVTGHQTSGTDTLSDGTQSETITAGAVSQLILTLAGQSFTDGTGNSGAVITQTAGASFTIAKISATDAYLNLNTGYTGTKTLVYSGPANSPSGTAPSYVTSVAFTSGQSTTTLTTTLYKAEQVGNFQVTESGQSYGVSASQLTVNPASSVCAASSLSTVTIDSTGLINTPKQIAIKLADSWGNGMPNIAASNIALAATATTVKLQQPSIPTDNAGNTSGFISWSTTGSKTITATISTTPVLTSTSSTACNTTPLGSGILSSQPSITINNNTQNNTPKTGVLFKGNIKFQ